MKITVKMHCRWRAVNNESEALGSFASKTWQKATALTCMKKIMKRHGRVKAITTNQLRFNRAAALKDIDNTSKQEVGL